MTLNLPETKNGPNMRKLRDFLSMLVARYIVGHFRYGKANVEKRYMTRLGLEYQNYKKKGNREQLINIAVYAVLEFFWPENELSHFNPKADSVTRKHL